MSWIKVTDRMPSPRSGNTFISVDVLVHIQGQDVEIEIGYHAASGWRATTGRKIDVTYWQPLPDPPTY